MGCQQTVGGELCRDSRQCSVVEFAFSLEVLACFNIQTEKLFFFLLLRVSNFYLSVLCGLLCKTGHEYRGHHSSSSDSPGWTRRWSLGVLTEPLWHSRCPAKQTARGGWNASLPGEGQRKGPPGTGWCFSTLSQCGSPGICPPDIRGTGCTLSGLNPVQKWAGMNLL